MNRSSQPDDRFADRIADVDRALFDALRYERRHAAVMFLSVGMALGIGFALALDRLMGSGLAATP